MFYINDKVYVRDQGKKTKGRIIGVDFFDNVITYIVELINKTEVRVNYYQLSCF